MLYSEWLDMPGGLIWHQREAGSRIEGEEAVPASSKFAASYYESYITCAPQPLTLSPWKPV